MDLEPVLNEKERVLAVPTDKTDVLNEALKIVQNYNNWKENYKAKIYK